MVWRQCMACNSKVPVSKRACVCGHVLTERKMIGRKRYSGYRAMLYSRNDQIKNIRKTNSPIQMISIRNKVIRIDSNENKHVMKMDLQFLKLKL
ncbi:uncharacterized protein LOC124438567 isoform X3 [Xenia sp. Carnegie-2017]|uniref:uncharacterized protein LOC124438567 isoform X3 n=1 Tax=Xenia sp. Carnegie-2017 TaxID=2897299 RepID=UPI001F03B853|nr:uncharacterized protein LOC124438567 isoform X3 [Xenia sp. Carnegie-2017]